LKDRRQPQDRLAVVTCEPSVNLTPGLIEAVGRIDASYRNGVSISST
jgi:hypothetical protein